MSRRVVWVLVAFNNEDEICHFVEKELLPSQHEFLHILVVNNSGGNGLSRLLAANVEVLVSDKNLGYLGAANYAKSYYFSKFGIPDLFILSNSDLTFVHRDAVLKIKNLESDFELGGPAIASADTHYALNPFMIKRISKSKIRFLIFIYSIYLFYLVYQLLSVFKRKIFGRKQEETKGRDDNIYAIHGSLMIMSRTFFQKGGHLDFKSFLYGEEIFLAELAHKGRMRVRYFPEIKVIHKEHTTTGLYKSQKHISWMRSSLRYLLKTFFYE